MSHNAARLKKLETLIRGTPLPLQKTAKNLVFGKGNPDAVLMFIGEAPGAKEDEQGVPFVGAAGRELDRLLHLIGLSLDDIYIGNILKYRPPDNRNPLAAEIEAHTPFLIRQIRIIRPQVIAALGNFATRFVLSGFLCDRMASVPGISRLHGRVSPMSIDGLSFRAVPLYHPAAMLYNPGLRPVMEKDFRALGRLLRTAGCQKI